MAHSAGYKPALLNRYAIPQSDDMKERSEDEDTARQDAMTVKMRVGLLMIAAGIVLLAIFFALWDPNALLRPTDDAEVPGDSGPGPRASLADLRETLAAYNHDLPPLAFSRERARWEYLAGMTGGDRHPLEAARLDLLELAGGRGTLDRLRPWFDRPDLDDLALRQVAAVRRLAVLRPMSLAGPDRDLLDSPPADPEGLPMVFRVRDRAARALGYASWLDAMADDAALDADRWLGLARSVLQAASPLASAVRGEVLARLGADAGSPDRPTPCDVLGSGGAGRVDRALAVLARDSAPTADRAWRSALAFRAALELPSLPASTGPGDSLPVRGDVPEPLVFILDTGGDFRAVLPATGTIDGPDCAGALAMVDIMAATGRQGLPPLLRGPSCRLMDRALRHLYTLAARSTLAADTGKEPTPKDLLREAVTGPVLTLPLYAGAYADWLEMMNRGQLPGPMVGIRFWEFAGRDAQLAPPAGIDPNAVLPTAAFARDAGPVAPLEDLLGWAVAHQLHRYICTQLLHADVHRADYRHNLKVADFLDSLLRTGAGADWQITLRQATGEDFDPRALVEYYRPLSDRLAAP